MNQSKGDNMKKKIIVLALIVMLCTACNGNVTRDIRHAGFSIGDKFVCNGFFPEDKEDVSFNRIRYFTGSHLIDQTGKIYELSLGQKFQNKQNCKKADTTMIVKSIFDDKIVKAIDDKYYYLTAQNNVSAYSEIPETDNSYLIYDLLLKEPDVIKVTTANSSTGEYYILKTDGNIYGYTITKKDHNSPPQVTAISVVYNRNDYGSKIIDYNYAGNSLSTFIETEKDVYRMHITNQECTKYADINCVFALKKDEMFNEYKERILAFNGSMLLTDYNQLFTLSS